MALHLPSVNRTSSSHCLGGDYQFPPKQTMNTDFLPPTIILNRDSPTVFCILGEAAKGGAQWTADLYPLCGRKLHTISSDAPRRISQSSLLRLPISRSFNVFPILSKKQGSAPLTTISASALLRLQSSAVVRLLGFSSTALHRGPDTLSISTRFMDETRNGV